MSPRRPSSTTLPGRLNSTRNLPCAATAAAAHRPRRGGQRARVGWRCVAPAPALVYPPPRHASHTCVLAVDDGPGVGHQAVELAGKGVVARPRCAKRYACQAAHWDARYVGGQRPAGRHDGQAPAGERLCDVYRAQHTHGAAQAVTGHHDSEGHRRRVGAAAAALPLHARGAVAAGRALLLLAGRPGALGRGLPEGAASGAAAVGGEEGRLHGGVLHPLQDLVDAPQHCQVVPVLIPRLHKPQMAQRPGGHQRRTPRRTVRGAPHLQPRWENLGIWRTRRWRWRQRAVGCTCSPTHSLPMPRPTPASSHLDISLDVPDAEGAPEGHQQAVAAPRQQAVGVVGGLAQPLVVPQVVQLLQRANRRQLRVLRQVGAQRQTHMVWRPGKAWGGLGRPGTSGARATPPPLCQRLACEKWRYTCRLAYAALRAPSNTNMGSSGRPPRAATAAGTSASILQPAWQGTD